MTNATQTILNALSARYQTTADGMYEGFQLEDLAEYMGITPDECDVMLNDAENEGVIYTEWSDVYNAHDLAEYEREEEEYEAECEAEAQAYMDAARGWYAFAC